MHPLKLAVKIKYIKNPFLYWSFYPHSGKKFLLLKKQTSDLSPPTFNPSNYRNKSNKPSKHPTAFEGVCFFKSNKFFLSVLPSKTPPITTKSTMRSPPLRLTKYSPFPNRRLLIHSLRKLHKQIPLFLT